MEKLPPMTQMDATQQFLVSAYFEQLEDSVHFVHKHRSQGQRCISMRGSHELSCGLLSGRWVGCCCGESCAY
eukprot:1013492-Amphidinium_carterae.1